MTAIILEVVDLKKHFFEKKGWFRKAQVIKAVDGVSLNLAENEICGIVGESGCGKTTLGKVILNLYPATSGKIFYKKQNTGNRKGFSIPRKHAQMIFQDPFSSLNPIQSIERILEVPLKTHENYPKADRKDRIRQSLEEVGVNPNFRSRYPHEFSGGQRQRIGIARALILNPEIIIADEPVSKLDVSIQAQILNLMMDLQEEHRFSMLLISHDLKVIKHICHRVLVMYMGEIIESVDKEIIFENPLHPYTQALIAAIPQLFSGKRIQHKKITEGEPPSLYELPSGCRFHPRCDRRMDICSQKKPEFQAVSEKHEVRCHLYD